MLQKRKIGKVEGGIALKVTVKEWRIMSDHNKQLLLRALANK